MLIKNNTTLIKFVGIVLLSSVSFSTAIAGGADGHISDGTENGGWINGKYEPNLLRTNSKYPNVGLRKEMRNDCYCDGAYFAIGGGYAIGSAQTLQGGPVLLPDGSVDPSLPVIVNPGAFNRAINSIAMTGSQITGSFMAGYKFANLRVEASGEYRHHLVGNSATTIGGVAVTVGAATRQFVPMVSAFYDIEIDGFPVIPYVGLGGGFATTSTSYSISHDNLGVITTGGLNYERTTSFVGAAMAGVALNITKDITLDVGYRLTNTYGGNAKFMGANNALALNTSAGVNLINSAGMGTFTDPGTGVTSTESLIYPDIITHEVKAGVRYRF